MDVVEAVRSGAGQFEWVEVVSEKAGTKLYVCVMRDGLKIGGVRVAANARQLQEIADILECSLLTPKVVDLVWEQATIRFDPVIRADNNIVAVSTSERVSALIDAEIEKHGGDQGGIIDSVGKYWVLHNHLASPAGLTYGVASACNYGWVSHSGAYAALTPGLKCWQTPGFQHNDQHVDPSQLVRLMLRKVRVVHADGTEETMDVLDVFKSPTLAPLINHDGVLRHLRMAGAPAPSAG